MFKKQTYKIISIILLLVASFAIFYAIPVLAQMDAWGGQASNIQAQTGLGDTDPRVMIAKVIQVALGFLGIIAVGLIMYAGFLWMTASGEQEKIDKAKKILTQAAIGLVIILSSFGIATFVLNSLLGISGGSSPCVDGDISGTCGCSNSGALTCVGGNWQCLGSLCGAGGGMTYCDSNFIASGGICSINDSCATDQFCDFGGCVCKPLGGVGDPCDNDNATPTCEANNNMCQTDLFCDINSCVCDGAPVIDYVDPVGGFCTGSVDSACVANSDCAAFVPNTCATSTPNGAIGNMITIGGRFFGTSTGSVYFAKIANPTNASDWIEAELADTVNPSCDQVWSKNKVVVIVPVGITAMGPIKIERDDGLGTNNPIDTTNNTNRGPIIDDFVLNNIVRPGICEVNPEQGKYQDEVAYFGINMAGGQAFFGKFGAATVSALASNFVADTGTSTVPNVKAGGTATYLLDGLKISNSYPFEVISDISKNHFISFFDPITGNDGQYVSIHGQGFGWASFIQLGVTHRVFFDTNLSDNDLGDITTLGMEADYSFPKVCQENLWRDKQIIIKTPKSSLVNMNKYYLVVYVSGEFIIDSSVVISSGNTSPTFEYNNSLSLTPGICSVTPVIGTENITPVYIYGELFGDRSTGHLDFTGVDMFAFDDISDSNDPMDHGWIQTVPEFDKADYIATTVPQNAITGQIKVKQGASISNGVNFEIGSCLDAGNSQSERNAACGAWCCGENTWQSGRCVNNINDCSGGINNSVYEIEFSTSKATSSSNIGSCGGYDMLQCNDLMNCPNSPGNCSPDSGVIKGGECGDTYCSSACGAIACAYDTGKNRCLSSTACDLKYSETKNIDGQDVKFEFYCNNYNSTFDSVSGNFWHIKTNGSCPDASVNFGLSNSSDWRNIGNMTCVDINNTCDYCSGIDCVDDGNGDKKGICGIEAKLCQNGFDCNLASGYCEKSTGDCECCCDESKNTVSGNPACCAPLNCGGECGASPSLGVCTGCVVLDSNGLISASMSDSMCNCTGTTGKYCDTTYDANGDGAIGTGDGQCLDCSKLSNLSPADCSEHAGSCCVDGANGNVCEGRPGNADIITGDSPNLAYCEYYNCNALGDACNSNNPLVSGGTYDNLKDCNSSCVNMGSNVGLSCDVDPDPMAASCTATFCSNPYSCLSSNPVSDCGSCCCDIDNDQCNLINSALTCNYVSDGNCADDFKGSPPDYGLCCGCSADDQCGATGSVGCGDDTCCRPRPEIISTMPTDDATSTCRNAKIEIEFDQKMDISSFTSNVVVLGDYGVNQCPEGTQYLSANYNRQNLFQRSYYKIIGMIKSILPNFVANALFAPTNHNYCAITGSVTGYIDASDHGILEFFPKKFLDPGRLYYVIVKGDQDLDSAKGVKSLWGIGMNGSATTAINPITFNGITYVNAYTFSFETLSEQSKNNGVCELGSVIVDPDKYLFKTVKNDPNENDTDAGVSSFDTVKDADKIFAANGYSSDGQILSPISGIYDWIFDWNSSMPSVADVVNLSGLSDNKKLVRAQSDVVDGKTDIIATAQILNNTITGNMMPISGKSEVYVFVCDNPWPPIKNDGTWSPWRDDVDGMSCVNGLCHNTNYELYYCRDNGEPGTYDDLPAITTSDSVVKGQELGKDILKEVYFFRGKEAILTTGTKNSVQATNTPLSINGGSATITWNPALDANSYRIYWGNEAGKLSNSTEVPGTEFSVAIPGLTNGQTYYFNVTSVNSTSGAESKYFNDTSASLLVKDLVAPAVPVLTAAPGDAKVELSWSSVTGAVKYIVYYGTNSGIYGNFEEVGDDTAVIVSGLTNGSNYFFAVVAEDEAGNRSSYQNPDFQVTPQPLAVGFFNAGDIILNWDTLSQNGDYNMYYEEIE